MIRNTIGWILGVEIDMKVITSPLQKKIVCLQMYTHAQVALVQTCTSTVEMKCVTA